MMGSTGIFGLAIAGACVLIAFLVSTTHPWGVFLAFVFARVSLDGFKVGTAEDAATVDPASIVGIAFIAYALLWLILIREERHPTSTVTKILYALCLWAFLSAAFCPFPVDAAISATKLLAGVLMFTVLEQALPDHPERVRQVLGTVVASAIIPGLLGLYQGISGHGNTTETPGFNRVYGTTVHPTSFANYLIIVLLACVVLALRGKHRGFYLILAGLASLLIYWTYTRSAWLAAAAGIVLIIRRLNKWLLFPAFAAVGVLPLVNPAIAQRFSDLNDPAPVVTTYTTSYSVNSLSWRLEYWREVIHLSDHDRLLGIGLDNVQRMTTFGLKPHNLFIQTYVELGIVGLALTILLVLVFARHLTVRRRRASTDLEKMTATLAVAVTACIFVESMVTNPLTSTMLWWYLAAGITFGFGGDSEPGNRPDRVSHWRPRAAMGRAARVGTRSLAGGR